MVATRSQHCNIESEATYAPSVARVSNRTFPSSPPPDSRSESGTAPDGAQEQIIFVHNVVVGAGAPIKH
ncbi:MAG: hypothetical protein ACKER6_01110 [Candidatus Hodgkinia cicadicola]